MSYRSSLSECWKNSGPAVAEMARSDGRLVELARRGAHTLVDYLSGFESRAWESYPQVDSSVLLRGTAFEDETDLNLAEFYGDTTDV